MSDNADKIKKVESNVIYLYDQNNNDFLTIENNIVTLDVRNKINPSYYFSNERVITLEVNKLVLINQTIVSFTGTKIINKIKIVYNDRNSSRAEKEFTNCILRIVNLYTYFLYYLVLGLN